MSERTSLPKSLNAWLCWIALWLVTLVLCVSEQFADPDLWGRLSMAALVTENHVFPYRDVFSYTAFHAPWVDHEWLTGFVFLPLLLWSGDAGFLVFKYLLILATLGALFWLHRRVYCVSPAYSLYGGLLLLNFYTMGYSATLRAQVFSFLWFTVFIAVLEAVRLQKLSLRWVYLLALVFPLWANFHGGFIMGFILLSLYGVGALLNTRALKSGLPYAISICSGALLLSLLNPYGLKYWQFLFHAWTLNRSYIAEWSPLLLNEFRFWDTQILIGIILVLLLIRWGVAFRRKKAIQPLLTPTLVLGWLIAMVFKGIRFQTFLGLGCLAYLPAIYSPDSLKFLMQPVTSWLQAKTGFFEKIMPVLLIVASLIGLGWFNHYHLLWKLPVQDEMALGKVSTRYPVGAIRYLQSSPYQGNLMIRFGLGEFAYWCLYPRFKVSMDGRYEEVYTQEQFLNNFRIQRQGTPQETEQSLQSLNRSAADFVLLSMKFPIVARLFHHPKWEVLYGDNHFVLFGRKASLAHFPKEAPARALIKTFYVEDFVTPADVKRFKAI